MISISHDDTGLLVGLEIPDELTFGKEDWQSFLYLNEFKISFDYRF